MSEYVLRTYDLCKRYGDKYAVDHVDMEIKKGQIYGFIGRNGAGKSTLIRTISGLATPSGGSIEIFSQNTPTSLVKAREKMGCIVESPAIYPNLNAAENLEVQRLVTGTPGNDCIKDSLHLVGLESTGNKKAKRFSLGMKQRLGLAATLLHNPEFIILDEPANGLDPAGIAELREILKRINREREITILISSHILDELSQVATCFGIIHEGKLIRQLTAEELAVACRQCLSITVDSTEKAVQIIETKFKASDFEVLPHNVIRLYSHLDKAAEVNKALVNEDIEVTGLTLMGQNLESYFIGMTGGVNHD